MISYTLLQLVQTVLSSMDGDEVNSISDTTESLQVAACAGVVYNDLLTQADLPEQHRLFSLTASGDTDLPVIMYRPTSFETVNWIKYKRTIDDADDSRLNWTVLTPIPFDEFLRRQDGLDLDDTSVAQMDVELDDTTLEILYHTDRSPTYYATFDDNTIVFDSIDLDVDTTLQSSKTLCHGQYTTQFLLVDTFTPTFDSGVHQIWLHETKALASAEMRQVPNMKAEKAARKGWIKLQDMKQAISTGGYYNHLPNYGRK